MGQRTVVVKQTSNSPSIRKWPGRNSERGFGSLGTSSAIQWKARQAFEQETECDELHGRGGGTFRLAVDRNPATDAWKGT
jgi:hypothetical protein